MKRSKHANHQKSFTGPQLQVRKNLRFFFTNLKVITIDKNIHDEDQRKLNITKNRISEVEG